MTLNAPDVGSRGPSACFLCSKKPELWVHGESDDYTPIGPCRDYTKRIGEAGTPVEFVSLPGAHHKFDDVNQRRAFGRSLQRTLESCPLEMDIDTLKTYDHNTGLQLSGVTLLKELKSCSALGATVEGNIMARDRSGEIIVAFLRRVFNP
jgi:hypothetical protein